MKLPSIDRLDAVTIEPGDIIIATLDDYDVSPEGLELIRGRLQLEFPENKVVVLAGLELWIGRTP